MTFLNGSSILRSINIIVSWLCAALLAGVGIALLIVRSSGRRKKIHAVRTLMRSDVEYYLNKSPTNTSRRIIEDGAKKNSSRITDPPQFNRTVPAVMSDSRDAKEDCVQMLAKIRLALKPSHGHNAELMSMRSCLACVEGTWPVEEGERFIRVYEKIVFGVFREGCTSLSLNNEDIQFLKLFFYHKVMQEL